MDEREPTASDTYSKNSFSGWCGDLKWGIDCNGVVGGSGVVDVVGIVVGIVVVMLV